MFYIFKKVSSNRIEIHFVRKYSKKALLDSIISIMCSFKKFFH
jgi:hypothetical protein